MIISGMRGYHGWGHLRGKRGHILIMAVFIAIFLFFLCVALVSQNRQNILLVLSEDHRLRATNSANAALDLALHVMRHNPEWRTLLPERKGELSSGGKWEIKSIKYLSENPHYLEITCRGSEGIFAATRKRVVEELAFDTATQGDNGDHPTHLFAYANVEGKNQLAVLTPDMRWRLLGALPHQGDAWVVAQDGPLFTQCYPRDHQFTIEDVGKDGLMKTTSITSATQPLAFLHLEDSTFKWSDAKFPCNGFMSTSTPEGEESGKASDPSIYSPGSGKESLTKYCDAEVRNLMYEGPTLEWYTSTGSAIAAEKGVAYCHAIHHYYRGAQAKISSQGYSVLRAPRTYTAPAVLRYVSTTDSWSVVMDMMQVTDRYQEPTIKATNSGNTPNTDTLACIGGEPYCISNTNSERVLRLTSKEWQGCGSTDSISGGLFSYNGRLIHQKVVTTEDGDTCVDFASLNLVNSLSETRPAITMASDEEAATGTQNIEVFPAYKVRTSLPISVTEHPTFSRQGINSTATCGQDLYTFVRVKATLESPSEALKDLYPDLFTLLSQQQTTIGGQFIDCIAHYDGEGWQLWPNGFNDIAIDWTGNAANARPCQIVDTNGTTATLSNTHLAAAYYEGVKQTRLNRYSVIYDQEGGE